MVATVKEIAANSCREADNIFYPTEDDEQLAETREHLLVIFSVFGILCRYLVGKAVVFCDQFLYHIEGNPNARVAPDIMVVFGIPLKVYSNYKIWEGQQTPAIIFEMTSESTKNRDLDFKKNRYAEIGVQEYWLFDPYGEWILGQLQGYRLDEEGLYQPIDDNCSQVLQLRLQVEQMSIGFYRLDTNEKLLDADELELVCHEAEQQLKAEKTRADRLAQRLKELGIEDV